jgi:quercetin dioxygenase-like cupin family protein
MEIRIIRKGDREYQKVESFTEVYANRVASLQKGQFRFMLSKIEPHGKVPPHDHEEVQLNMIEKGTARMRIGETDCVLHEGDLVVVPGGAVHEMESEADGEQVSYIEVKWLAQ